MTQSRSLATDGVVTLSDGVVVIERDTPPHEGELALPGGSVERGETAREACVREVREETGIEVEATELLGLYDDPGRDERGNASAAYLCEPVGDPEPDPGEEARRVTTVDPESVEDLVFDHEVIVSDAVAAHATV